MENDMQHLDEGTIHAWLDGALDASEASRIELHVAACATCSAAVAEARGFIAGSSRIVSSLDVVRGGVIPKSSSAGSRERSVWRRLRLTPLRAMLAASVLFAAAMIATVQRQDSTSAVMSKREAVATPAAPSAQPVAAPTVAATPARVARSDSASPAPPASARDLAKSNALAKAADQTHALASTAPAEASADRTAGAVAAKSAIAVDSAATKPITAANAVATNEPVAQRSAAGAAAVVPTPTIDRMQKSLADARSLRQVAEAPAVLESRRNGAEVGAGCYRVASDSAAASLRAIGFPPRFSLDSGSNGKNVVRLVSVSNRPDSVLENFDWRRTQPSGTAIVWTPDAKIRPQALASAQSFATSPRVQTVLLQSTGDGITGKFLNAANRSFELTRIVCKP